ncbi:MAG: hypothetical protein U5K00_06310 [Melioribacteraceae bacterium]|nr:hypothetical protein [Melioribacteraceae bacterium]
MTKAKTKAELIKSVLRNIIQKNNLLALKKYKGAVDLSINLDELRGRGQSFSR